MDSVAPQNNCHESLTLHSNGRISCKGAGRFQSTHIMSLTPFFPLTAYTRVKCFQPKNKELSLGNFQPCFSRRVKKPFHKKNESMIFLSPSFEGCGGGRPVEHCHCEYSSSLCSSSNYRVSECIIDHLITNACFISCRVSLIFCWALSFPICLSIPFPCQLLFYCCFGVFFPPLRLPLFWT